MYSYPPKLCPIYNHLSNKWKRSKKMLSILMVLSYFAVRVIFFPLCFLSCVPAGPEEDPGDYLSGEAAAAAQGLGHRSTSRPKEIEPLRRLGD